MTSFALLITLGLALATLTLLFVLWPLGTRESPRDTAADRARQDTLAILRERRHDLTQTLPEASAEQQQALAELATQASLELNDTAEPAPPARAGAPRQRTAAVLVALALLGLCIPLYFMTGSPAAVTDGATATAEPQSLDELAATLQQRLQHDPKNVGAWQLLGQAELARGAPQAAQAALERALALDPQDPQIKVDLADALGQAQGARLEGRPIALIREALIQAPQHPKALALAGAYAVGQRDFATALQHWRALLDILPADAPQAAQIRGFVADLESGHTPRVPDAPEPADAPSTPVTLRGTVVLAPALSSQVQASDTVFIVARTVDATGTPVGPPVALQRAQAADLPLRFELGDRDAMSPQARLSSLPAGQSLRVVARITRSGQAQPQAGDLQGQTPPFVPGSQDLTLQIDSVIGP